ncbi:hypothetical protein [Streptomyces sp. OE57]|uniref:hypothetical protein n=1 Tax=Streptomyces lacaronensis TaxID=3379885 RepID=UPI0039B7739C
MSPLQRVKSARPQHAPRTASRGPWQDTGYEPAYDTERAVAEYLAWLRAGNER